MQMFSNKICWSLRDLWNKFFKKTNTKKKKQTQHYNKLPEKTVILKSVENTRAHLHKHRLHKDDKDKQ